VTEKRLKVLILGGYGKFGGQLAELLADETRLTLIIAGRSQQKADAYCERLPPGAGRMGEAVDRNGDIEFRLREIRPDLVVDASGPFQAYGDDPYRVVKAALNAGCHYVDFADGSDFVHGIVRFEEAARRASLVVLSGVSSFPALTAAVARHLSAGLRHVDSIIGGIAPTPYAGVGQSVVSAIAGYAGQKVSVRSNGETREAYALTETRPYTIGPPGVVPLNKLRFSLVDVPDLESLPELWPDVQTVWMGAGPVPAVVHRMLRGLAYLVRWRLVPTLVPFSKLLFHANNILRWGEHRGGMFVEVSGRTDEGRSVTRSWHLLAEGNDGTFIPSMAIETLVRRWVDGNAPDSGARVASREIELPDYEKLFVHRRIYAGHRGGEHVVDPSLYGRVLGDAWNSLPLAVRELHGQPTSSRVHGTASITRGKGMVSHAVARLFGFPEAADAVDVTVMFERTGGTERWTRTFGGRSFVSHQYEGTGRFERLLCERFGPFEFGLALVVEPEKLVLVVRRWSLLGVPLPRRLAPGGDALEFEKDGRFHFDVEIRLPVVGKIVRYAGWLESRNASSGFACQNRNRAPNVGPDSASCSSSLPDSSL